MQSYQTPVVQDVFDAATRLRGVAIETPIVRSDLLDEITGAQVFVKLESLQHTGAFKFRGAYNCLSRLDRDACPDGVVAYSTGNHGQAIATVGRMLGIPTMVVMPSNAPENKVEKARLAVVADDASARAAKRSRRNWRRRAALPWCRRAITIT
jgi:threonine dehydratase